MTIAIQWGVKLAMAEILSQKEIDELLSALSTGEVDVAEIQDQAEENKIKRI